MSLIYLIGMPACGKSYTGKALAKKLKMSFLDTDDWIEEKSGMTVGEIFTKHGESVFRRWEERAFLHSKDQVNLLVATGGGFPMYYRRMDRMNEIGLTVFYDCGLDILIERISAQGKRPLLQGSNLYNKLEVLLLDRHGTYEEAKLIVHNPEFRSTDELKGLISERLG